jgi:FkbM family methyltransferase
VLVAIAVVKRAIREALRRRGLALVPFDEHEARVAGVRDEWLRTLGVRTVIDVGANHGGFARRIRRILPDAVLHCFEPLPEPFEKLCASFREDARFHATGVALGAVRGTAQFNANESSGSSSLLPMANLHREAYPHTRHSTNIDVVCTTLDEHFQGFDLDPGVLLKLDVQGGEQLVLAGGTLTLRRVQVIFAELSFFELYEGQPLASEVVRGIESAGFTLGGIENVSRSVRDGRFLQCDAYFLGDDARRRLA